MDDTAMRHCIERKRDGHALSATDWDAIIDGFMEGRIDEAQTAALFMACVWRGMTFEEAHALTDAMVRSGETISFERKKGIVVDKHSSGGVADIVSLVAVPLAAACGARVAKLSGRALGHTGGTIDKLEAVPGFNAALSLDTFIRQVETIGCAIAAQTQALVPADKRIYNLRDRTGTVPAMGLIAASIVSKKIACGAHAIVFDVKTGPASFTPHPDQARELAQWLVEISKGFGRKAIAFVSDMHQPLGRTVGTGIEMVEARDVLRHSDVILSLSKDPERSRGVKLILKVVAALLDASEIPGGEERAAKALGDGSGYTKLVEMVEAQGASRGALEGMELDGQPLIVKASQSGFVQTIDVVHLGNAGRRLSHHDRLGGLFVNAQIGDRVEAGQPLARVYGKDKEHVRNLEGSFKIGSDPAEPPPLIYDTIT
ncbi:MAG TPA: thymidine phosphorylase [Candidatus Rubrimentiphilum sp.]|nr:thymidine phosphorylase [Candidatus Rubrimentiphilum sp.]